MKNALSPLDGRYAAKADPLRSFFIEEALIAARVEVEIRYFMKLSDVVTVKELPKLSMAQKKKLCLIIHNFSDADAARVKQIEKKTNHDVKAVEYFLQEKFKKIGLSKCTSFIHFALTSEDVNNLAYGLLISRALKEVVRPKVQEVAKAFRSCSKRWSNVTMLSLTHGQPATPTTLGKEFAVFADRLDRQLAHLTVFKMEGKFGGAVGNYSAHQAAYPKVKWEEFGRKFVNSLGLDPLILTTQINPHDDIAELSHICFRVNTILIDAARDIWTYISRGVFKQKLIKGEVGSSTMPHKVNPIDFENAEGNFGLSNALFDHFATKLPISRLQRDLTDSTVQRSIGTAFGYQLIAFEAMLKGFSKLELDRGVVKEELKKHPELAAEAIQTVLRKCGVPDAYERLKELTRGEKVSKKDMVAFIESLPIPKKEKDGLKEGVKQYF